VTLVLIRVLVSGYIFMKKQELIKEFSRLSQKELQRVLQEKREKLRQLRFDLASGKVKNVREIREIKKDIARLLTVLRITNATRITNIRNSK